MKIIKYDDKEILLDDDDFEFVDKFYNIDMNKSGYVTVSLKKEYRKLNLGLYDYLLLHKLIIHPDKTGRSINVDHIDHNKLNNLKNNLRVISHKDNTRYRKAFKSMNGKPLTSKYKGVQWNKAQGCWRVVLGSADSKDKKFYGGLFLDEIAAANCYNNIVKERYGEFAVLNDCPYMPEEEWNSFRKPIERTSEYRGVSFDNSKNKWLVQIWDGKRNIRVGYFDEELEAAIAYNRKAFELKGDKARLNAI
jgi:hypothetical protein